KGRLALEPWRRMGANPELVVASLRGLQGRVRRYARLQPRADGTGSRAGQLEEPGRAEALRVTEVEPQRAGQVVVEPDRRVGAVELVHAAGARPIHRVAVLDVVAEPVPSARGGDDQAIAVAQHVAGDVERVLQKPVHRGLG